MKRIEHNVKTGIVTELELTKNEIEFALLETQQIQQIVSEKQAEAAAKATAKAALLTKLGITADEAALLLGGN